MEDGMIDTNAIECFRTPQLAAEYPEMKFTVVLASGVVRSAFASAVKEFAGDIADQLADVDPDVEAHLECFEAFFEKNSQCFPLRRQIRAAAKNGFPCVPPPVLALLALEASTGVLMGVQDADAIEEHVTLDLLTSQESFTGMRGANVRCEEGEIVVRDGRAIIASLFQGPDKRTAAKPTSQNLVFYVFDSDPSLGGGHAACVEAVVSLLTPNARETSVLPAE
jgi:hypothetical protein